MRRQLRLHRPCFAIRQKVEEALVHCQPRADGLALRQNPPHERPVRGLTRRVVWLAEKHPVDGRLNRIQNVVRQRKIVFFTQHMPMNLAIDRFQRRRVFGERRRENQRMLGLFRQSQSENQIRRAVSAENPRFGHSLRLAQRRSQCAAERIGV